MNVAADPFVNSALLDIKLPDGNGYEIAEGLRQNSDVPIVFLTTRDSESERILGFEVGADDYVAKFFSMAASTPGDPFHRKQHRYRTAREALHVVLGYERKRAFVPELAIRSKGG